MDNLQKSELMIAKILDAVVSNGLQPMRLKFLDLGLEADFEVFFDSSVSWLQTERILRAAEPYPTMGSVSTEVINPVLTAHGLSLMSQEFVFEGRSETVGSAVKKVASGEGNWSNVGSFFGAALAAFTKNIGS